MIQSLLDNDLYKFTMHQAVLEKHPERRARYVFLDRDPDRVYPPEFVECLRADVEAMGRLRLRREEREWLETTQQFPPKYLDVLAAYRFRPDQVGITTEGDKGFKLVIEGPWQETILWEVPLLAMITQRMYERVETDWERDYEAYYERSLEKAEALSEAGCEFADFGTRRRRHVAFQELALKAFKLTESQSSRGHFFAGTSNLHFARTLGLPAVGSLAHEWIMAHSVIAGLQEANGEALKSWLEVHGGRYATALTDTYTLDLFFLNFTARMARQFDSVRHDSGDPFDFVDTFINFFHECGIDPQTKTLRFSDSLNVRQARKIEQYVGGRAGTSYEIGAFLTNDFPRQKPPSMVIKLVRLDDTPVVKVSSDRNKSVGDPDVLEGVFHKIKDIRKRMEDSSNPFNYS